MLVPRIKNLIVALLSLFLFLSPSAWSRSIHTLRSEGVRSVDQYMLEVWRIEDGLQQSSIYKLVQTPDGYLWMATWGGLIRFDGVHFTVFDPTNTDGTTKGLARFAKGRFSSYTTKDGLPSNSIGPIIEDKFGNLWVGTERGLARFNGGRFTTYSVMDGLPNNPVGYLYSDNQGSLWIGTLKQLTRFAHGRFTSYSIKNGIPSEIREDAEGGLWIRTNASKWKDGKFGNAAQIPSVENNVLWLYKNGELKGYSSKDGLSDRPILSLSVDHEGSLWIGRDGVGWQGLRPAVATTYAKEAGLLDESVSAVYESKDGSVWIGTESGGLNRLQGQKMVVFTKRDGLPSNKIGSLAEDREGRLWVGTDNGLVWFEDGKFISPPSADALLGKTVLCMFIDRNGSLWVGTEGDGAYRLTPEKGVAYTTEQGLSSNYVRSIFQDREGAIWFGTDDGITRMKNGQFTVYNTKD